MGEVVVGLCELDEFFYLGVVAEDGDDVGVFLAAVVVSHVEGGVEDAVDGGFEFGCGVAFAESGSDFGLSFCSEDGFAAFAVPCLFDPVVEYCLDVCVCGVGHVVFRGWKSGRMSHVVFLGGCLGVGGVWG